MRRGSYRGGLGGLPELAALAAIFMISCFCIAVPIGAVVARGAGSEEALGSLFDPSLLAIVRATLEQACWSALLSAAIGLPLGLWIGGHASVGARSARWAQALLAVPYGVPTVVVGMAGVTWLGRSGPLAALGLDWSYSLRAVILAHVLLNAPWVALLVAQARGQVPRPQLEAARTLGAGAGSRAAWILWPYVRWALAAATAQVFALCSMSFALVLILGGGPPVETLETAIYARVRYSALDWQGAAACAIWQLALTLSPWGLVLFFQARDRAIQSQAVREAVGAPGARWEGRRPAAVRWQSVAQIGASAAFVLPYPVAIAAGSFSLNEELLAEVAGSLGWSALLAIAATALAMGAATAGIVSARAVERAWPRWGWVLPVALSLPGAISVLVLGLGFWLAYGRWIDPFDGSFGAMAALQGTVFFPIAFRMLWPVAMGSQTRLLEAAATMGASPLRAFLEVEWPRWKAPLVSAAAMVAGASLGEVAAVSLFASESLVPLPLLVTRWMAQYRFEEARAVSGLIFGISAAVIAVVSLQGSGWARREGAA